MKERGDTVFVTFANFKKNFDLFKNYFVEIKNY